jgi:hypothetical protein
LFFVIFCHFGIFSKNRLGDGIVFCEKDMVSFDEFSASVEAEELYVINII